MTIHGTMTTSSKKDYLSILGLSYEFDDIELKKAFRREARKWHPDLNKNDINAEDRFKLINEAYEFLRDPARRAKTIDSNSSNDENFNNYKTGFPEYKDYLNSLFGFEYESELDNESYYQTSDFYEEEKPDEIFNEEEFNSHDYPARSPEEPPPVKLHQDIETIIELTPDEGVALDYGCGNGAFLCALGGAHPRLTLEAADIGRHLAEDVLGIPGIRN